MKKVLAMTFGTICAASVVTSAAAMGQILEHTGIYAAATYSKPSNNGVSMGDMQTLVFQSGAGTGSMQGSMDPFNRTLFLEPDFEWDYSAGISYHFPHSHTRIFVEYDNYTDSAERVADGVRDLGLRPSLLVPPSFGPGSTFTTSETANVHERVQELRIGLNHFLHFGPRFFLDLSGYIEGAKATRGINQLISMPNEGIRDQIDSDAFRSTSNRFEGWGPGVGLKIIGIPYAPCTNFSIFAGVATTLLYGSNNFNVYEIGDDVLVYEYNPENSKSVVSQFDIDFGIDYRHILHVNGKKMRAGVTLGVFYTNLVNVFKNGDTYYNTPTRPQLLNIAAPAFPRQFSANLGNANDWGRVGPYLQFRIGGDKA